MKNKIYAVIFCFVTFFMLLSIIFSIMDKIFGVDNIFLSNKSTFLFMFSGVTISVFLTILIYIVVFFIQLSVRL
jgi:hypothetical protein